MKKFAFAPLAITAALALSACGEKTENTTVTNEVVLNEELPVTENLTENLTAIDSLNATDTVLDNAAVETLNATDAAGNAAANTL